MKIIFKITKAELRNLFYSPVPWFLTIIFLIQCAYSYFYILYGSAKYQGIIEKNNPHWRGFTDSMTFTVFYGYPGIYGRILDNLYLFIPLLTMGVISREINSGTIRLLYSSPIRTRHIVLGKFLAVLLFNLLLISVFGIFVIDAAFHIKDMDYGMMLAAILGLYLLVCCYTAIGIFMSSLSNYQVISAIGTFMILFMLEKIGNLWQDHVFIRDLTYFLSIRNRAGIMRNGLLRSKDVLYFVAIVYMFLCFTLIRLKAQRESRPWYIGAARYITVLATVLTVGYISSRPSLTGYWDVTTLKTNTLHPNVQKILKELKEPVEITLYTNLFMSDNICLPIERNNYLTYLWERYQRFKPDLDFKYYYYYAVKKDDSSYYKYYPHKTLREIAQLEAAGHGADFSIFQSPEEFGKKSIEKLEPEDFRTVLQLKYKGRTTFLRTYDQGGFLPGDMQISAAFRRLLQDTLPKVYFITGDLERSVYKKGEREYSMHTLNKGWRNSLVNLGFDGDTLSLNDCVIPADAEIVVLADPKTRLSDTAMGRLRQYIDKGGDMFILGEPGKQEVLNPLLQSLGVRMLPGTIVEPTRNEMPQMVNAYLTDSCLNIANATSFVKMRQAHKEMNFDDSLKVILPGAAAIAADSGGPFTVQTLLKTMAQRTWIKQGSFATDSAEIIYDARAGDVKGAYAPAVALTRQRGSRQQRIVVCGDADLLSNTRLQPADDLPTAFYSWLDHNKFPVYAPQPRPTDTRLLVTAKTAYLLNILYLWILPALLLLSGTILLIRRKGR